jgi:flagellar biosynthesis protein FlhA
LAEEAPIKDLEVLFEAMTVRARISTVIEGLVEACRRAIAPAIVARITGQDDVLHVITLEPASEQVMIEGLRTTDQGSQIHLAPDKVEAFMTSLKQAAQKADTEAVAAALVCSPMIRPAVRKVAVLAAPELPVLSYPEVSAAHVQVETMGVVTISPAAPAQPASRPR